MSSEATPELTASDGRAAQQGSSAAGPALPTRPVIHEGRVLVLITSCMFLVTTNVNAMAPLLVVMADEFDTSVGAMGQLAAAASIPWAVLAPFMGVLADRYGRRKVLASGVAFLGAATILSGTMVSYGSLFAMRVVCGVGGATTGPNLMSAPSEYFPRHRQGKAAGLMLTGLSLATIVGVPMVALVAARAGWRMSFILLGSLAVVMSLLVLLVLPPGRSRSSGSGYFRPMLSALSVRATPPLLIANIMERSAFTAVITYLAAFLMQSYGLSLEMVAPILSGIAAGTLLGSILGGRLADRGRPWLVYGGFQLIYAALALLLFTTTPGVLATGVLAASVELSSSMARPSWLWLLSRTPEAHRGATMGFATTTNQIGVIVGAAVGGLLVGTGSYGPVSFLASALAVGASIGCVVARRRAMRNE